MGLGRAGQANSQGMARQPYLALHKKYGLTEQILGLQEHDCHSNTALHCRCWSVTMHSTSKLHKSAQARHQADLPPQIRLHSHSQLAGCQAPHTLHTHGSRLVGPSTVDAGLMQQLLSAAAGRHAGTATGPLCLAQAVQGCASRLHITLCQVPAFCRH